MQFSIIIIIIFKSNVFSLKNPFSINAKMIQLNQEYDLGK